MQTPVVFMTELDCCKRFMRPLSGLTLAAINPSVGDHVIVWKDSILEVWLKVIERRWVTTNGAGPVLICELGLRDGDTLEALVRRLGYKE